MPTFSFWPWFAGAVFFLIGLIAVFKEWRRSLDWDQVLVLGRILVASSLAVFGAEHLAMARAIMAAVPSWLPFPLFWVYFVGLALFAAAVSLTLKLHMRLAAALLALLIFTFVLTIHLPNLFAHLHERLFWTIALRDTCFAAGTLALAATPQNNDRGKRSAIFVEISRAIIMVTLVFFAAQLFLYPRFAPGVPLPKLTPAWVPLAPFWSYLCGAVFIFAAGSLLLKKHARQACAMAGLLMAFFTFALYLPILLMASGPQQIIEGMNYVADTLLFGGVLLLLGNALPRSLSGASESPANL